MLIAAGKLGGEWALLLGINGEDQENLAEGRGISVPLDSVLPYIEDPAAMKEIYVIGAKTNADIRAGMIANGWTTDETVEMFRSLGSHE